MLEASNIIKSEQWHRCSPAYFAKFFKNAYFVKNLQTAASVYCQANNTSMQKFVCTQFTAYSFGLIISKL